jgi:hypothetical protein
MARILEKDCNRYRKRLERTKSKEVLLRTTKLTKYRIVRN